MRFKRVCPRRSVKGAAQFRRGLAGAATLSRHETKPLTSLTHPLIEIAIIYR